MATNETANTAPVRTGRLAGAGLRVAKVDENKTGSTRRPRRANAVPEEILHDPELNSDISNLPTNYSFEIHKTVHRLRRANAKRVALQMPEGLVRYGCMISEILRKHANGVQTVILGDVTYGACCVDDFSAKALGCDFLVHYGHSCLVPVTKCMLPMLYVFVHIKFDPSHLVRCLKNNFASDVKMSLVGTIQFVDTIHTIRPELEEYFSDIEIPQAKPLSPGELLGCTAPKMPSREVLIYVGDGRFHLESAMIANPTLPAYRYDPYSKTITRELYDHPAMRTRRRDAVNTAKEAKFFGLILGTLGRQGSPAILERLKGALEEAGKKYFIVLVSEISAAKLELMEEAGTEAWIQIACPRLSIDWGTNYGKRPLLTPYEAFVALGKAQWKEEEYPMDFYARGSGPWTNYHKPDKTEANKKTAAVNSNTNLTEKLAKLSVEANKDPGAEKKHDSAVVDSVDNVSFMKAAGIAPKSTTGCSGCNCGK